MKAGQVIAIDLGRKRLRALFATATGSRRLKVHRVLIADPPTDLNHEDPQIVGNWLAEQFRQAGFPRGDATFSLGREHVVLKRLTLPTIDEAELPDMTRLAMQRELPFEADTAVIDFVIVERTETSSTVLAVAAPAPAIEFTKAVAKAAGIGIERIALRTMGTAGIVRDSSSDTSPCLVIDVLGEAVEFCLVTGGGSIRFSRAAEVPQPQDELAIADAVVTETRRTWMSYLGGGTNTGDDAIQRAIIVGERRVCEYAADPVSQMLKIPVSVLAEHPSIAWESSAEKDIDRVWPLAGLLLEAMQEKSGGLIDFANPHRAPDLAARTRQRRLIAAGIGLLVVLSAWTVMRQQLKSLQARADQLTTDQLNGIKGNNRYIRDVFKLEHLKRWDSAGVDWLQHANALTTICTNAAGGPDRLVLDSWTGQLEFQGVKFDTKTSKWSADKKWNISIDGEAKDRETADAFRAALVQSPIYSAATPGADAKGGKRMPFGFTYKLREKDPVPPAAASKTAPKSPDAKPS